MKLLKRLLIIVSTIIFTLNVAIKIFIITELNYLQINKKYYNYNFKSLKKIKNSKNIKSFIVLGDPKTSIIILNKTIKTINEKEKVNFIALLGDITNRSSLEEYLLFFKVIKGSRTPIFIIPGNHDVYKCGRAIFYKLFGSYYFSFNSNNAYFIFLDTSSKNQAFPFEMKWLKEELQKARRYKYRFAFMHIPPFDPRNKKEHCIRNYNYSKNLTKLLKRYKVTMIFCSHIHSFLKGVFNGVPFVITGEAGKPSGFQYIKVNLNNSSLQTYPVHIEITEIEKVLNYLISQIFIPLFVWFSQNWLLITILCFLVLFRCII